MIPSTAGHHRTILILQQESRELHGPASTQLRTGGPLRSVPDNTVSVTSHTVTQSRHWCSLTTSPLAIWATTLLLLTKDLYTRQIFWHVVFIHKPSCRVSPPVSLMSSSLRSVLTSTHRRPPPSIALCTCCSHLQACRHQGRLFIIASSLRAGWQVPGLGLCEVNLLWEEFHNS